MKQKAAFIITLSLCFFLQSTAFSQIWGNGVKGEGPVITKNLDISDFTGVKLTFSGDVILTQGQHYEVKVEGQKNIIDLLNTQVKDNIWKTGFTKNVGNHKGLKVYITMPTLTVVGLSGSGDISCTNAFTGLGSLKVFVSGSGNIDLDFTAEAVETSISGSGNIKLKGSATSQNIKISGSGDVKAYDLVCEEATVQISGSGNCKLQVKNALEAKISGSGDISNKGNPKVKSRITGSGDVNSH